MKLKIFGIVISVLLGILLILGGIVYWQRDTILERVAKEKLQKYEASRNVNIKFKSLKLNGLNELNLADFSVQEPGDPRFLYIKNMSCSVSIWNLLKGNVALNKLQLDDVDLYVCDTDTCRNFDFLLKHGDSSTKGNAKSKTIYEKFSDLLGKVFDMVPDELSVKNLTCKVTKRSHTALLVLPYLDVEDKSFKSNAYLTFDDEPAQNIQFCGNFDNSDRNVNCKFYTNTIRPLQLPYLQKRLGAKIKCDTFNVSFNIKEEGFDHLQLAGTAGISNLHIDYFRLADRDLNFGNTSIDYVVNVKNNSIELDSSSTAYFNKLSFHPYCLLNIKPALKIKVSVNKPTFPSDELFGSIPSGLFSNLDSIQTTGDLDYHFYCDFDESNVDSLHFRSSLNKHSNFGIVHYGKTDFTAINDQFEYFAYDDDKLVRNFSVGTDWDHFRPISEISPYLRSAILCSEDSRFYTHLGFYDGAIEKALISDIKQKRFARGGSSISMQLVKNVFLNKNKNLMRKMEEILIVWLIENNRLVSKDRMYEIYLNIIEWGPNYRVYGAEEAAQFYFNKHASEITPSEAIFLATIIPSPKKFMYKFGSDHMLKPNQQYYFRLIGQKMLSRGTITTEEYQTVSRENVIVRGPAVNYLPKLKIEVDSSSVDEGESLIELDE